MKRKPEKTKPAGKNGNYLYTMEVFLISGPMMETFVKKNSVIARTVEIRGDQTLAHLHKIIFEAFDREEEHMYEFQIGGKGPMDPKAKRYGSSTDIDASLGDSKPAKKASRTTIDSLRLKINDAFGYWFDFGDDWWHQINILEIKQEVPEGNYPRIIKREGKSPPQYVDFDSKK